MIFRLITILTLFVSLSWHILAAHSLDSLRSLDLAESTDTLLKKKGAIDQRVSLSAGIARSFGFAGVTVSYDCGDYWGSDLSFGAVVFPHSWSLSLRYNAIRRRGLLLSPRFTAYTCDNNWYGAAISADFRAYLNNSFFLINTAGIECSFIESQRIIWPHTGMGLGFTIGGAPKSWTSSREHEIGKIAISGIILNIAFTAIFFMVYFGETITGPPID